MRYHFFLTCALSISFSVIAIQGHCQQTSTDDPITHYSDEVGDVTKKLPTPDATYLDIKQITVEKIKTDKFAFTIELASELPRRPDMTINHYLIMDLDKNKSTGKINTSDTNFGYDAYVSIGLYKDKGREKIWTGTYGNLLEDFDFEADRLKIKDNIISFEVTCKWFKDHSSYKFRIYNWVSTFDEDDDEASNRLPVDSTGTQLYPKKK
jgi:hypothetical protein